MNKCPECGAEVAIDASGMVCAACAMRLALASDSVGNGSLSNFDLDPAIPQTSGSVLPPGGFTRWLAHPFGRWSMFILAVLITLYVGIRIARDQQTFRPPLQIDASLRPMLDINAFGLDPGHRLVEVNGSPVSGQGQIAARIDAENRPTTADFTFVSNTTPSERVRVTWMQVPYIPEFGVSAEGEFEPGGEGKFPELVLGNQESIRAIDGVPLSTIVADGIDPASLRHWYTQITALDPDRPGERHEFIVYTFLWRQYWGRFVSGAAFMALGLLALWYRPQSKSARAFFLFSTFIGLMMYARSLEFFHRFPLEMAAYHVLQIFSPVALVLLVLTYSPLRAVARRPGVWMGSAAVACLILLVVNAVSAPGAARYGLLSNKLFLVWALAMLLLVVCSGLADVIVRLTGVRLSPTDRQRVRVVRLAILLGFLPFALYTVAAYVVEKPMYYRFLVEMSVLTFPALILYAISRHNLLDMNELARQGLVYGLLLGLITLGYSGGLAVITSLLDQTAGVTATGIRTTLVAGVFLVAIPAYTWTRKTLDTRFSRVPAEYETLMSSLESGSAPDTTPHEYCQHVVAQLRGVTSASSVSLLTNFDEYGGWAFAAVTPTIRTDQTVERCRPMLDALARDKKTVFRQDLIEFAEQSDEAVRSLDAMDSVDAEVVYPLVAYQRVVGALCIGSKSSGRNFTAPELKSIERAARFMANALTNLLGRVASLGGKRIADVFPRYPDRIGGYTIEGVLGEGGMAFVYHGKDPSGRDVAVKVANRLVQSSPALLERFQREAAVVQRLTSPHIVEVLEVGWQGPEPYIVLEYFAKGSLDQTLKARGRLPEAEALRIVADVARGLDAANKEGIIHRDIKPRNIFMTTDGRAKVGDFGLALISDRTPITVTGEMFGTPDYMAPELARGERATWKADQYALGITLFELLAGNKPYKGHKFEAILYQHIHEPLPNLQRKLRMSVSNKTVDVVTRMLAKDAGGRYSNYDELLREIEG